MAYVYKLFIKTQATFYPHISNDPQVLHIYTPLIFIYL